MTVSIVCRALNLSICAMTILVIGAPACSWAAQDVKVSISVDRSQIEVGESTVLTLQIVGSQDSGAPNFAGIDGFRVRYIGPSTQMKFVNGNMSSSVAHRFNLVAVKPGNFNLGPFNVDVAGVSHRSNGIVVRVLPRGKAVKKAGGGVQLEVRLGRERPFIGERVPLTVRLLIPGGTAVDDLNFPEIEGENLLVGEMPQPVQRDEQIGGRRYRVLYLETHVTPLRPGAAELRATMSLNVLQRRKGRRTNVFDMFGGGFSQKRPLDLRSDPLSYEVRALPSEGKPSGFAGAVGNFDLRVSASPRQVAAGDPVTVRVVVQGRGDLAKVAPPRLDASDHFRAYDPVPLKDLGPGKSGFEQVVIPLSDEVTELPALSLSFFDPQAEEYRVIQRGPIALQVSAAAAARSAVVAQGDSGRAELGTGPDWARHRLHQKGSR